MFQMFPLVGVPNWLATILPVLFSPEQHQNAAVGPAILCLIAGIAMLLPPMISGAKNDLNKSWIIAGLCVMLMGLLFLLFGGYAMALLVVLVICLIPVGIRRVVFILK